MKSGNLLKGKTDWGEHSNIKPNECHKLTFNSTILFCCNVSLCLCLLVCLSLSLSLSRCIHTSPHFSQSSTRKEQDIRFRATTSPGYTSVKPRLSTPSTDKSYIIWLCSRPTLASFVRSRILPLHMWWKVKPLMKCSLHSEASTLHSHYYRYMIWLSSTSTSEDEADYILLNNDILLSLVGIFLSWKPLPSGYEGLIFHISFFMIKCKRMGENHRQT